MTTFFQAMPGLEMPIRDVSRTLRDMWQEDPIDTQRPFSHATQINLILHHGLLSTVPQARQCFDTALKLSKKIPTRLVVLCPEPEPQKQLYGKLFSQCFLAQNLRDACCCEALMLGYSINEAQFISDHVSLWINKDLPIYYWFNAVRPDPLQEYYLHLTHNCSKVLFDTSVVGDQYDNIPWITPTSDLAWHRSLPIRQNLGQFLSSFSPETLVDGLKSVSISYKPCRIAKARHLLEWTQTCLNKCPDRLIEYRTFEHAHDDHVIEIYWEYDNGKTFDFWYSHERQLGEIHTNLSGKQTTTSLQIKPMSPKDVLEAALYY